MTPPLAAPARPAEPPDPALDSILSQKLFPKHNVLQVQQVADALCVTKQHIINLIEEGHIQAVDVGGGPIDRANTARRNYRIPVSAYDAFIRKRKF
jgi:hypothetical protein